MGQFRLLLALSFWKACDRRVVALKPLLGPHPLDFRSLKEKSISSSCRAVCEKVPVSPTCVKSRCSEILGRCSG